MEARAPNRVARSVGLLIALGLVPVLIGACGALQRTASGSFTPTREAALTVATAEIPEPGFWRGTPNHLTGGFEYELARALAHKLGLNEVEVRLVPFDEILTGDLGGADLAISDITATTERERKLTFSTPYLAAPPSILVRPGTFVNDVHAAARLRYAVQGGTTLEAALEESIRPTHAPEIVHHQSEAIEALRSGRVNAVMLDLPVALSFARGAPHLYAVAAQLQSEAMLAVALPKGSPNVEAVSSALRALEAEGVVERLGKRWLHTYLIEGAAEHVPVLRAGE